MAQLDRFYKADRSGHYLSMSVDPNSRQVRIYESKVLEAGETMSHPHGAHVLLIVASPINGEAAQLNDLNKA